MITENSPARLLVEGRDDKHSIIHLMMRHNVDWDNSAASLPYVNDCGGIDALLESVSVSAKSYPRLGIVIDANEEVEIRWEHLKRKLGSVDVRIPACPNPAGIVLQGIFPDWKVGVWLMPDNSAPGELEHFIQTLVPAEDVC